jgi:hypothetical protein
MRVAQGQIPESRIWRKNCVYFCEFSFWRHGKSAIDRVEIKKNNGIWQRRLSSRRQLVLGGRKVKPTLLFFWLVVFLFTI